MAGLFSIKESGEIDKKTEAHIYCEARNHWIHTYIWVVLNKKGISHRKQLN